MSTPAPGFTFVSGRSSETARTLLDAARDLGLDSAVVRTSQFGYIVPDAVFDAAYPTDQGF